MTQGFKPGDERVANIITTERNREMSRRAGFGSKIIFFIFESMFLFTKATHSHCVLVL